MFAYSPLTAGDRGALRLQRRVIVSPIIVGNVASIASGPSEQGGSTSQPVEIIGVPAMAAHGVAFAARGRDGRQRRFVVSALALDELERGRAAPSNWLRVFSEHDSTILAVAAKAVAADPHAECIVLNLGYFSAACDPTLIDAEVIYGSALVAPAPAVGLAVSKAPHLGP